jgi:hypothetical protein
MLGNFQQSQIRIEVAANSATIRQQLLSPAHLRKWLSATKLTLEGDDLLQVDRTFAIEVWPVRVTHKVSKVTDDSLRLCLSEAIDGYQEWYWGDGWVQSRLAGVSLLPLSAIQTTNLTRLRWALSRFGKADATRTTN